MNFIKEKLNRSKIIVFIIIGILLIINTNCEKEVLKLRDIYVGDYDCFKEDYAWGSSGYELVDTSWVTVSVKKDGKYKSRLLILGTSVNLEKSGYFWDDFRNITGSFSDSVYIAFRLSNYDRYYTYTGKKIE
jgi:hypothetical protein